MKVANLIPRVRRRRRGAIRRYARNPGRRRTRLFRNPIDSIMGVVKDAFNMDTAETVFHSALGFGGTLVGAKLVHRHLIPALGDTPVGRVATTVGVTLIETIASQYLGGSRLSSRVMIGGLLASAWVGLSEAVRGTKAADIVPTLGDTSASFERAIQEEVLREMRGGVEGRSVYLPAAGVSYLPPAGSSAYLTAREAGRAQQLSTYLTANEIRRAEAGMGAPVNEFSRESMPERF